jgi:hypothetical protein
MKKLQDQRHGSADPEPDPHQNVMDPEHWFNRQAVVVLRPSVCSVCVGMHWEGGGGCRIGQKAML